MEKTGSLRTKSNDVLQGIKELVIRVGKLGVPIADISDTASFAEDCGFDSLSVIDLLVAAEKLFDVRLLDDDLDHTTLRDIASFARYVESRTSSQLKAE